MDHVEELRSIFSQPDLYRAHEECVPVMNAMGRDQEFFFGVIRGCLSDPEYLGRVRHYPTLAFPIEENEDFTLVANVFLPLPDKSRDLSFQSIHHHGQLILTTISAFGAGYESIVFKPGYSIDEETGLTDMQMDRFYHNELYNLAFIDKLTPHVVFYPEAPSITLALWSREKHEALDRMKKMRVRQSMKKPLKRIITMAGLNAAVGLNQVDHNDFYPKDGKIWGLKDRLGYPEGTNDNWLQNVFSVVQQYGFDDKDFLKQLKADCEARGQSAPSRWIDRFLAGETIDLEFEPHHLNVDKVNLSKREILAVYGREAN